MRHIYALHFRFAWDQKACRVNFTDLAYALAEADSIDWSGWGDPTSKLPMTHRGSGFQDGGLDHYTGAAWWINEERVKR